MTPHRFTVGQIVTYSQTRFPNMLSGAQCRIARLLPTRPQPLGPEYLIRCDRFARELIVGEHELSEIRSPSGGGSRAERPPGRQHARTTMPGTPGGPWQPPRAALARRPNPRFRTNQADLA